MRRAWGQPLCRVAWSILLLGGVAACRGTEGARPAAEAPPNGEVRFEPDSPSLKYLTVDTVRLRQERVVSVLPARLVMDEDHTVRVLPPVTGRIQSLDVEPGDPVREGQPLAHILSSDFAQAASDLAKAQAALNQMETALARARDLYEHHVIALKELEQARSDEAQARAEAERAQARVRLLGGNGGAEGSVFVLRSPLAGEVVERTANPGQEVRPDAAVPLFTVSLLDTLWLTAGVYQRDLALVRRGNRLVFRTDAVPGQRFTATVRYVSASLDPQTRTATLRAALPNPGQILKPEMFGEARLMAPEPNGAVVVPSGALVTRGTQVLVFVQRGPGRFVPREVTVADDDGETAAIASGLERGELVVTRGSILLAAQSGGAP